MVEKGGRRDIFLGTRECQGYVESCVFGEGESYYDHYGELEFGLMFHGFDYPDETRQNILVARFWKPKMVNGVVQFLPPEELPEEMKRNIRPMKAKQFGEKFGNFQRFEGGDTEAGVGLGRRGNEMSWMQKLCEAYDAGIVW